MLFVQPILKTFLDLEFRTPKTFWKLLAKIILNHYLPLDILRLQTFLNGYYCGKVYSVATLCMLHLVVKTIWECNLAYEIISLTKKAPIELWLLNWNRAYQNELEFLQFHQNLSFLIIVLFTKIRAKAQKHFLNWSRIH